MLEIKNTLLNLAQLEKLILVNISGVVECLRNKLITVEHAEKAIFSPYSIDLLKNKGICTEIIDLIHMGMELEDIESLMPEKLESSIAEIKSKTKSLLEKRKEVSFEENILK
ncbi:DUF3969 family protein [Bacillus sp. JJ722]|uniref:DUF3969 family protein n=1 Tax=Bacillus sp. JJ722 TaxID=3122973 RepID=UPI002FFDF6AA